MSDELLSLKSIGGRYHIPIASLRAAIREGLLQATKTGSGYRVSQAEFDRYFRVETERVRDRIRAISRHLASDAAAGNLVQATVHATQCPSCQTIQGRIYGVTGEHSGFPALDERVINAFHAGCAHTLMPVEEDFLDARGLRDAQAALSRSSRPVVSSQDWLKALVEFGAPSALVAGRDGELQERITACFKEEGVSHAASASWDWQREEYTVLLWVPYGRRWYRAFPAPMVHAWLDGHDNRFWDAMRAGIAELSAATAEPSGRVREDVPVAPDATPEAQPRPRGCVLALAACLRVVLRKL